MREVEDKGYSACVNCSRVEITNQEKYSQSLKGLVERAREDIEAEELEGNEWAKGESDD